MCRGRQHIEKFGQECESYFGKECKVFAKQRVVTWDNDINKGKGKKSKFNSRWDEDAMLIKLHELGFIEKNQAEDLYKSIITDTTNTTSTGNDTKTTTDSTNENTDLIKVLRELNELYESGALTKEEFEKAKKKLLDQ